MNPSGVKLETQKMSYGELSLTAVANNRFSSAVWAAKKAFWGGDNLDPAVVRTGRFDRKIEFPTRRRA